MDKSVNNEPIIYVGFDGSGKEKFIAEQTVGDKGYRTKIFAPVTKRTGKSLFEQQARKAGYMVIPWQNRRTSK